MGQAIRPEPEVDLHVLQAQVMAQGLLLKAIARTIDDPARVRQFFAQELDRVLPTLSEETMGFVAVQANVMIHQFYGTAGPRTGPPPAPAAGRP